jgi:succinylarginine dihydrolase
MRGFGDEGAANHTRISVPDLAAGVHLFAYGSGGEVAEEQRHFPPRQSRAASEAVARLPGLAPDATVFARQNPAALDAGVFHNDVISVGHEDLFLCHEQAFVATEGTLRALRRAFQKKCGRLLRVFVVPARALSLAEAVATYLFNSQIVSTPEGFVLLAAMECRRHGKAKAVLEKLVAEGFVARVEYADLRQSMRNGGGPACLRLRVELTAEEWRATAPAFRFDAALHAKLRKWVERHYRDRLGPGDLRDPELPKECASAFYALDRLLGTSVYSTHAG